MKMNTDGWYVDLPEFSCPLTARPQIPQMPSDDEDSRSQDRMVFKTTGSGKLGFPLPETRTVNMGETNITSSVETLEFSKAVLPATLFDIPAGCTKTDNSQSLYGTPDMSAMMRNMGGDNDDDDKPTNKSNGNQMTAPTKQSIGVKKAGTIRIGVYALTNKNGENVPTTNMQMFLIKKSTGGSVEAIAVSSESEAKAASCDYVLTSDFSKLKQSAAGKIGGMFGKVTGTNTSAARNYDAQVDFKLASLTGGKIVSNEAANKSESDVDRAAELVLSQEASQILSQIGN